MSQHPSTPPLPIGRRGFIIDAGSLEAAQRMLADAPAYQPWLHGKRYAVIYVDPIGAVEAHARAKRLGLNPSMLRTWYSQARPHEVAA